MTQGRKLNRAVRRAIVALLTFMLATGWKPAPAATYLRMVALSEIDDWLEKQLAPEVSPEVSQEVSQIGTDWRSDEAH